MSADQPDRRRDPRATAGTFAGVSTQRGDATDQHVIGHVANVSRRGLSVRAPKALVVDEPVAVRIAAGQTLHRLRARVRRVEATGNGLFEIGLELEPQEVELPAFIAAMVPCTLERASR